MSRRLVFVISALILIVLLVIIMGTNQRFKDSSEISLQSTSGMQLRVEGVIERRILDPPRLGEWEVADELWDDPVYYSSNVKFLNGVVDVQTPGVYRMTADVALIFYNDSYDDVPIDVGVRIIRGGIQHRFEYDLREVTATSSDSITIPQRSRREILVSCDAILDVTQSEIIDGAGKFATQYRVSLAGDVESRRLADHRIDVDRNSENITSRIIVVKLN